MAHSNRWPPGFDPKEFLEGKVCVYCGSDKDMTIDHKIPRAKGGTDDRSNLQPACRSCNSSKCDKDEDYYLRYWAPRPKMSVADALARARALGA